MSGHLADVPYLDVVKFGKASVYSAVVGNLTAMDSSLDFVTRSAFLQHALHVTKAYRC